MNYLLNEKPRGKMKKYRFYDPFNEIMVYSYKFNSLYQFYKEYQRTIEGENQPILMQGLELQDINNKEYYEGDEVKSFNGVGTIIYKDRIYSLTSELQEIFESCHNEFLVAFSCKRRGFCPSCGTRRMAESAALLVDEILPYEAIRQ